jgi:hypothetical protein
MNKLYKAGLAVLAIALLTSSALAYSPVWNNIPDVIVGDGDLVFTNAFAWQDYVSDQDTTPISNLQVVFAEGAWNTGEADRSLQTVDGSTSNEVGINAQTEADYTGVGGVIVTDPITFDGSTILSNWLTFTASSSADRAVVLIASDGATTPVASDVFRVRENASLPDQLTYPVQKVALDSWDTDGDWSADWGFISLSAPTSVTGGGSIGINSLLATQNDFAFWQLLPSATLIPINSGQLLRGRWTINGGTTATNAWPSIQMRFFHENDAEYQWTAVSASGYVPAPNTSRTYESFMQPSSALVGTDLFAGFYVIDTSTAQGGTFSVEKLDIDGITGLDGLFTQEFVIDSGEAIDFTSAVDLYLGSNITATQNADSFTYNVTTANAGDFSLAQINTGFTMAANTLYRVINTVSSSQTAVNQPFFETRAFSTNNEVIVVTQDQGNGTVSAHMPDAGGKDYATYLPSTGIDGLELRVSFDILNAAGTNRTGAMSWDRVVVESVPLSSIP